MILEARNNGARLIPTCEVVGISVRTYERWCKKGNVAEDRRPLAIRKSPTNKLTVEEYERVLEIVISPEYADLPPAQIVPSLADAGIYIASESTMYRILRKELMQKHRGRSKSPVKVNHPTTHIATGQNQVWTWDITYLYSYIHGIYYKLYMVMDIFSRKIVGWEVWEAESGELAAALMERTIINEKTRGKPLVLHSDNGGPMKSHTLKTKLETLGVMPSYSRPRVSNDNPYSESLFKTCKYRSNYPQKGFETIEEARQWVYDFVNWYNNKHYHSGLNFMTPTARHTGEALIIMQKRKLVYDLAKKRHPHRFNRGIRKWDLPATVALNPTDESKTTLNQTI